MASSKLRRSLVIGQVWRLPSGEVVTIVSLPDDRGWMQCLSHDVGYQRTYGSFVFGQPNSVLLEDKGLPDRTSLRELIREIVREEMRAVGKARRGR